MNTGSTTKTIGNRDSEGLQPGFERRVRVSANVPPAGSHSALDDFASGLGFELDGFPAARGVRTPGRSAGVLVAAPTGSGKTTVAEFAVHLARREFGSRVFYTAPIKALSNQKFAELCTEYGEAEVGLLTGDVNLRGDAPIVVMTTEVLHQHDLRGQSRAR